LWNFFRQAKMSMLYYLIILRLIKSMSQPKSFWDMGLSRKSFWSVLRVGKNFTSCLRMIPERIAARLNSLLILIIPINAPLLGPLRSLRGVQHTGWGYWRQVRSSSAILVTCFVERLSNALQVQIELLLHLRRNKLRHTSSRLSFTYSRNMFTCSWARDVTRLRHCNRKLIFRQFYFLSCLRFCRPIIINLF
jgi:hypothetical protein